MVTNVKVELRGTLVWFDSRIGLLQEKIKSMVGSATFDTACMPVRTQRIKVCESSVKKHGEHREKPAIQLEFLQKKFLLSQGGPFHGKS